MNREVDLQTLKTLHHLKECVVGWSEGGGGQVFKVLDQYVLFEVTQYGTSTNYYGTYNVNQLDMLLDIVYTWT